MTITVHPDQAASGLIPVGLVDWRCQKDKYENDVSIITMSDGYTFRMVHHSKKFQDHQRATIYAGRGKFVRLKSFASENPCAETSIEIAGYSMSWGDGEPLRSESNPNGPNLNDLLMQVRNDNFDAVIVNVLAAIQRVDAAWETKPVKGRNT